MEKTARKPSADPAQERLRQNKAVWNKEVSAFINDLIHFKKMMNGWPSKFFKERSRITQPVPADPATIIGSLAGDFQDLAQKGNGLIQQQLDYAKNRRQKQPKAPTPAQPQQPGGEAPPPAAPATPASPDLSKQLSQGLAASEVRLNLIKVASVFEEKYFLESQASNPFTRFITKLFTPKFGFGEGARIRRLRMTMLDSCVKTLQTLKQLHKEIVKSNKESVVVSHKMMTQAWNYWNIVNRLYSAFNMVKPGKVVEQGGQIEDEELRREREAEEKGEQPDKPPTRPSSIVTDLVGKLKDFKQSAAILGGSVQNTQFKILNSLIERISAMPKSKSLTPEEIAALERGYQEALVATAQELGFSNMTSFSQIAQTVVTKANQQTKEAQLRELRRVRHQILPGATSGSRLEVYNLIEQIRKDLDKVMNLLEAGFDQKQLTPAIATVNRGMTSLRTMIRSLYYSEKPEEAPPAFF